MHAARLLPVLAFALAGAAAVQAQTIQLAPPANVVSLTASASTEVTKDWLGIALSTTRDGSDAATVQSQLKQALDAALTEARKAARPGQIEVRTGHFGIYPRYSNKGAPAGWTGSAELLIEGRDVQGLSQLAGRVQTLTVSRVQFSLSREAREKVEAEVTGQAIAQFRARAEQIAKQFGFAGYTLREVNVSGSEMAVGIQPMRAQLARSDAEALPVEAGKATVTISVGGSVQLFVR